MATSQVTIMNRALIKLGATTITSPTDSVKEARTLLRSYESVLRFLLEQHDWSFAIQRQTLAELTETPAYEYLYAFGLPNGYIRCIEVYPKYVKYRIEGTSVLTNHSSLSMKFVKYTDNESVFSAEFCELFSLALAKECAYSITQSRAKESDLSEAFDKALALAKSNNSKGAGTIQPFADDVWMSSRGYGNDSDQNAVVQTGYDYGSVS